MAHNPSILPLISVEEHWLSPTITSLYRTHSTPDPNDPNGPVGSYVPKLLDVGPDRLSSLSSGNIAVQILSHVANSIAIPATTCRTVNDELSAVIRKGKGRYAAFAMLPMSEPVLAAEELKRCVTQLGFVGAMIDSNCAGKFYDDEKYWPVFAAAEELDVPIYLHPAPNADTRPGFEGNYPSMVAEVLSQYCWGWHSETAMSFLRLFVAGAFDRFKGLKMILGHHGEMLPFQLDRIEGITSRAMPLLGCKLERSMREVWKENVWVSVSGMFTVAPMLTVLEQCKPDHILYSVDYPFGHTEAGPNFLGTLKERGLVNDAGLEQFAYKNAQKLLRIRMPEEWEPTK